MIAGRALDTGAACNNRCAICPRESGPILDGAELEARVGQGAGPVVLHGGEPTLRDDLDRLIARATAAGRAVTLETNGRALAVDGRAESARRAGLVSASVALLGATAAGHDFLTRAPGSFRQSVAGATRLRAAGVRLTARLVVTRPSLPSLGAMTALALGLGAREVRFTWARADGDGGAARQWLVPRYALALPPLLAATAAVARAGRAVSVDGVPRCLAPAPAMATAAACFAPTGGDDRFSPRCDGCAARSDCPGVPAGYLDRFGDGELVPVL